MAGKQPYLDQAGVERLVGNVINQLALKANIEDLRNYVTKSELAQEDTSLYHFKGTVDDLDDVANPNFGDIYVVNSSSKKFLWNGVKWEEFNNNTIKPGTGLSLEDDGTLSITDEYTNNILSSTSESANRASQSAIVAGNYAAQAIQAQIAINNKIWYGTMEEYNNLETVSQSTIYIILHE